MARIEIKNLNFTYPEEREPALKDITFTIEEGTYLAVCGKSGSGKSTLLRHLKPVLAPAGTLTGSVLLDGREIREVSAYEQASVIGYVLQNPETQIVTDKVWHELAFGLENLGIERSIIRTSVAEMASYFGIQSWFYRDVSELSGGQKQLLNLASVMAMHPQVLVLDEPTSQLDPIAASDFLNTVRKINLELGTTVIITEHRLEDILPSADQVLIMESGEVFYQGTPRNAGEKLYREENDLTAILPAPVRIYYQVKRDQGGDTCPLTVREGRQWLSSLFRDTGTMKFSMNNDHPAIKVSEHENSLSSASGQKINGAVSPLGEQAVWKSSGSGTSEEILSLRDVWFRYEKNSPDILKGLNLTVYKGEFLAIVGGNGAGKSTTLKLISRTLQPYRGKIELKGKKLSRYKAAELYKNNIAMLPQDPQSLFVRQTVREELEEMLGHDLAEKYERRVELEGSEAVPLHEKVQKAAELCQILPFMDRHPYDLSGGEQQRLALAKVLLTDPDVLLMDEPTKGVDGLFKIRFADILSDLRKQGVTIIMVSHDIEFCAEYTDRVGMFFDGEITAIDPPDIFFSRNSFYTTSANRMARHLFPLAATADAVAECVMNSLKKS